MKTSKKVLSVLLAVLVFLSLGVSAFAAGVTLPENVKRAAADAMGVSIDKIVPVEVEKKGNSYEFEVFFNKASYEFEISSNGTIIKFSYEKSFGSNGIFVIKTGGPYISVDEAKSAAFAKAGINANAAKHIEVSFEIEHSKAYYDIEFTAGGYEYEIEVDAKTADARITEKEGNGGNQGGFFARLKAFFENLFAIIKGWFSK